MTVRLAYCEIIETAGIGIRRFIILACLLVFVGGYSARAADERFDTLTVGHQTFTKVLVLNKTRNDVFISHAKGMCSLKVKDLDIATQLKLGYQVEQPKPNKMVQMEEVFKAPDLENLEEDPRMKNLDAETAARITETAARVSQIIKELDPTAIYGILGGIALSYLLFCFLCRSLCLKTAAPPTALVPLVWFPFVKQIPLLKAAGMSPWWILTNFVPPLTLVTYITWSFKIVRARGKHVIFAIMLLFPITNILSFLFLALSRGCGDDPSNRNVITLQSGPRKEAA
jgi:hypothetical protein